MDYINVNDTSVSYSYDQLKNLTIILFYVKNDNIRFGEDENLTKLHITYRYHKKTIEDIHNIVLRECESENLELSHDLRNDGFDY